MTEKEFLRNLGKRARENQHEPVDVTRDVLDRLPRRRTSPVRLAACIAVAAVLMLAVGGWLLTRAPQGNPPIANANPPLEFNLPDSYGRFHSLAELSGDELTVVAFLGVECPLSRLYAPRLQELHEQYAPRGVRFVGIDANPQDSLTDMQAFAHQLELTFPLLKDRDQSLADRLGAMRNPEVFVLDAGRELRYRGRIDDQFGLGPSSGYARSGPTQKYLGSALDELLAGGDVSQIEVPAVGCLIGRTPRTRPTGEITYTEHIAPLLDSYCVECHRPGQIGPFALTEYNEVAGWGAMIKEVVTQQRMPPWSAKAPPGMFANDCRLSESDKQLIVAWVDNGCPQGNPADLPSPLPRAEGWHIGKPDQVVSMAEPIHVPASGVLGYHNVVLDPGWTEDKWIAAAECAPGNRQVVHHVIVSIVDSDGRPRREPGEDSPRDLAARFGFREGMLVAYVPGFTGSTLPEGVAHFVPAGSKLNLQIHYTPNGRAVDDISSVALKFADPRLVRKRLHGGASLTASLSIPPHVPDHEASATSTIRDEQWLLWMSPHMHNRGKAMEFEALYPDGSRELLLQVPRYDFNWQLRYVLAEPKRLPAGTRILCRGWFDNSESNAANPDPSQTVRFGLQPSDEMLVGFYATVSVKDDVAADKDRSLPEAD